LVAGGFALVTWLFDGLSGFGLLSWWPELGALDFGPTARGAVSECEWALPGPRLCRPPEGWLSLCGLLVCGLLKGWPPPL